MENMESDLGEKQRFFTLYWGQDVVRHGFVDWDSLNHSIVSASMINYISNEHGDHSFISHLELTPLSQITDEHAIGASYDDRDEFLNHFEGFLCSNGDSLYSYQADFLRSKGYLLTWMNYSCEELVKKGWVKIKEV